MKDLLIREPTPNDIPFIYSTWLNSYKHDSDIGKSVKKSVFMEEYKLVVDEILNNENTRTWIACKKDEPNVIFGYIVEDLSSIHYCYVKENFRGLGIARELLGQRNDFKQISHRTFSLSPILTKHPELIYNPFILFKKGGHNG